MVGMAQACVMRTVGAAAWQAGFVVESAPGGYINARCHSAADADVLNVLPDAFVSLAATRTRLLMHCVREAPRAKRCASADHRTVMSPQPQAATARCARGCARCARV